VTGGPRVQQRCADRIGRAPWPVFTRESMTVPGLLPDSAQFRVAIEI